MRPQAAPRPAAHCALLALHSSRHSLPKCRPPRLLQLAQFTDDRRSCNKSLTSHNRRRRGVPRSAPRTGDSSSGGRRQRRMARGTPEAAAAANGLDTGSSGSIRGGGGASPHATAGNGGATPPASAAASGEGAEGSKSSTTPTHNGYLTSPAGSGRLAQEVPRHNSAPPAACVPPLAEQPLLPTIGEQGGLPWPQPPPAGRAASAPTTLPASMLPPLPSLPPLGLPWQGPEAALQAQDEEGRNFDSMLMGLLLADSPRADGEAQQQHAHAVLLDAYSSLLDQPVRACCCPGLAPLLGGTGTCCAVHLHGWAKLACMRTIVGSFVGPSFWYAVPA